MEVSDRQHALVPGKLVVVGYDNWRCETQNEDRTGQLLHRRHVGEGNAGREVTGHAAARSCNCTGSPASSAPIRQCTPLVDVDLSWSAANGCRSPALRPGKSTLLNIIGCLDRPTSGSYLLRRRRDRHAQRPANVPACAAERIGFVFQSFHLLPYRTVLENVMLAEVYRGSSQRGRRERAMAAIDGSGWRIAPISCPEAFGRRTPAGRDRTGPDRRTQSAAVRRADRQPGFQKLGV